MQFRVLGKMSIVNLLILLYVTDRDSTKMRNFLLEDDILQALAACRARVRLITNAGACPDKRSEEGGS